jgi:hypothetical protein
MARWEPGSSQRLQQAALDLFDEQGYDRTTVAEIAARAGVTERTFFLAVANSAATDPAEMAADALAGSSGFFGEERRPWARRRAAVVFGHPALAEREQLKMGALATAVAAALRERGVDEPAATLLAHSTITVFRVAFETWIADDTGRTMAQIQQELFAALRLSLAG